MILPDTDKKSECAALAIGKLFVNAQYGCTGKLHRRIGKASLYPLCRHHAGAGDGGSGIAFGWLLGNSIARPNRDVAGKDGTLSVLQDKCSAIFQRLRFAAVDGVGIDSIRVFPNLYGKAEHLCRSVLCGFRLLRSFRSEGN